ncbi:MAG: DUF4388 domain-containing protein [Deltaproteobacteria bacterium]|nr:DUF4388 domain-containing protein [Deltaproteobacteria bacterium]
MALEGNIKDFGITDILQLIGMQKKTGILTLTAGEDTATLTFEAGMVVAAESYRKKKSDLIGWALVESELLSKQDLERALARQKETGRKLGHILVEENLVRAEDLASMIQLQVRETVYRIFDWQEGIYRFAQQPSVTYDHTNMVPLSCEKILMEAMRIIDEWPLVRKVIHDYSRIFEKTDEKRMIDASAQDLDRAIDRMFEEGQEENLSDRKETLDQEFPLSPAEVRIYQLVEGTRDVQKLIHLGRIGTFETCKALYSLVSAGLIREISGKGETPAGAGRRGEKGRGKKVLRNLAAYVIMFLFLLLLVFASRKPTGGLLTAITGGVGTSLGPIRNVYAVREMDRIFFACDVYFLEEQVLPEDPVELVRKGILHSAELFDPWGRKYRYRSRNRTIFLKSFGADGVEGTSDDIVKEHVL